MFSSLKSLFLGSPRTVDKPTPTVARRAREAVDAPALLAAIRHGGCSRYRDIKALEQAIGAYEQWCEQAIGRPRFWGELLPWICEQALKFSELFQEPILLIAHNDKARAGGDNSRRSVEWTQAQCLCILCNSFLCSWPKRTSQNCRCAEAIDLPSINFDEMLTEQARPQVQVRFLRANQPVQSASSYCSTVCCVCAVHILSRAPFVTWIWVAGTRTGGEVRDVSVLPRQAARSPATW